MITSWKKKKKGEEERREGGSLSLFFRRQTPETGDKGFFCCRRLRMRGGMYSSDNGHRSNNGCTQRNCLEKKKGKNPLHFFSSSQPQPQPPCRVTQTTGEREMRDRRKRRRGRKGNKKDFPLYQEKTTAVRVRKGKKKKEEGTQLNLPILLLQQPSISGSYS